MELKFKFGFDVLVLDDIQTKNTTPNDTIIAAKKMKDHNVDLILFAGGDGTARNICSSIDVSIPVLGIPTGVKMHSGVFGITPSNSGTITSDFIQGKLKTSLIEVLDIDEKSFRKNILLTKFYGYLKVPVENELMQGVKGQSLTTETDAVDGIAYDIVSNLENDCLYVVGPGTTTVAIMEKLNLKSTLLVSITNYLCLKNSLTSPEDFWATWRERQRIEQFQTGLRLDMSHNNYGSLTLSEPGRTSPVR